MKKYERRSNEKLPLSLKSSEPILLGEPAYSQPFGILLKGFLFFMKYFPEKEGFLNRLVVLK